MKSKRGICLFLLLLATQAGPTFAESVRIPPGLPVDLVLIEQVEPRRVSIGDTLDLSAASDVVVRHRLVIERGSPGKAVVSTRKTRGPMGLPDELEITIASVVAVDGTVVLLRGQSHMRGEQRTVHAAGIGIFYCCLGLLVPGGTTKIPAGIVVTGFVVGDPSISVNQ